MTLNKWLLAAGLTLCICSLKAQELNCKVTVMAPQISNVEREVFQSLEEAISDFMNTRKWTDDVFDLDERIECTMQITISDAPTQTSFAGSVQLQSSRPVYHSDYNTPIFTMNDQDVAFAFTPGNFIAFGTDQHRDNLSSMLGYYAFMILAFDYDTFELEGGTPHFLKAQQVVANAQNSGASGWTASGGQKNRYWLVENILSQTFKPLRKASYEYHRKGLDQAYEDAALARKTISDAIVALRNIHQIKPSSYNMQLFFLAKADELINLFSPAEQEEKLRLFNILKLIDPGNISKYDKLVG